MYGKNHIEDVIQRLQDDGIARRFSDGRLVAEISNELIAETKKVDDKKSNEKKQVIIMKRDGSTLYISRDIAAALDRVKRYKFDKMFYIVEHGQSDHFQNLFALIKSLEKKKRLNMEHVRFGRIKGKAQYNLLTLNSPSLHFTFWETCKLLYREYYQKLQSKQIRWHLVIFFCNEGMSSRRGTAVFLKDILDEALDRMDEQRRESVNIRGEESENQFISDTLGMTAVLVNDLKQKRNKSYDFSWDKALLAKGDSGIKLQYTHCRLSSLLEANARGRNHLNQILQDRGV